MPSWAKDKENKWFIRSATIWMTRTREEQQLNVAYQSEYYSYWVSKPWKVIEEQRMLSGHSQPILQESESTARWKSTRHILPSPFIKTFWRLTSWWCTPELCTSFKADMILLSIVHLMRIYIWRGVQTVLTLFLKATYSLIKVRRSSPVIRHRRSHCSNVHEFLVRRGRTQASCKS
jgi:hypothetical protein